MFKLMDSGCEQHQPRQIRLTDSTAAWVDRLILNLPPTDAGHTYICEHGHTHCLTRSPQEAARTASPLGLGYAGGTVLTH